MKDVLNTPDMKMRPLVLGNVYLNVPGGNHLEYNNRLISLVEKIGEKQTALRGSKLKRGIFYIKQNTTCPSKRQIKMMLRNVPNAIVHESGYDSYIYRCSINHYVEIFNFIIEHSNINKHDYYSISDLLIPKVKSGLSYVSTHGTNDKTRENAADIYNGINY